ncbi:hypothetical protein [Bacillus sp. JJ722]|uniref:hypothetical protein n=1 Tax=Bacillus sp. JJ722 TaxID=3122973 RepID=UPI002FFF9B69
MGIIREIDCVLNSLIKSGKSKEDISMAVKKTSDSNIRTNRREKHDSKKIINHVKIE